MAGTYGQLYGIDYFYSSTYTDSFYTSTPSGEINMNQYALQASNYFYLFTFQKPGTVPICRYYNFNTNQMDHFYKAGGGSFSGYTFEGIIGYAWPSSGPSRVPIYRFWSPSTSDHRYLTSSSTSGGYAYEGIEWYSPIVVNGCSDSNATNYNPYVNQTSSGCTYSPPSVSFSCSPTSIIFGNSSTLSWSVGGYVTSVSIDQGIGGVSSSSSRTVSPTSTTTYTLTATGIGGTTTRQVTVIVTIPSPPTVSFSVSPSSICLGNSATLSWSATGYVNSVSIDQGIGGVSTSGNRTVSPTSTTTYTLTATGIGGTTTRSVTLDLNFPTTINLTADNSSIIVGGSTTLRWTSTGSITSATLNQGMGSVNNNGNQVVSPSVTTTYTISATGVCTNASSAVTVTVYQLPTVELSGPVSINYGQQGTLTYSATNVDISLILQPYYQYKNGSLSGPIYNTNLLTGATVSGSLQTVIPYNDFGPTSVTYVIVATGNGGQETKQITVPINIDETPDNFLIPDSDDLLKEQAPVSTPDATITSYQIQIDDIDIPVEVKSNKPILTKKNNDDWQNVRSI
jgi:hypothetical protein